MAAFSPVVGKYQFQLGRRNLSRWGMLIVAFPFLGFWLNDFSTSSFTFISIFILMRVIQGIGTSMVQTSAYAILTLTYPHDVNFVVSCLEMAAGLGLSLGPVIGTMLYKFGGIELTFISFFVL
jgi:MFS family permease